ncbi:histone-lysine N-methyltransferase 2C isoform X2 [Toxotes jaculatrix]|uniref:histone-lysine N-methyltransferase 2C isoform X2 n=1 Tax=Toxotes jaculatrix TaxID=941984 RepID=UPI001B3AAE71|nr:histone-lysine N-methyltransferase 2C isoform X2 [Toxotes jaculatrix]
MPSEAQSQEPRDRGPPPPVTRAGRSAQLAKAAATSPTPERRPRGRPRKDGSSGRSAAPAPPPPPPPTPPPPKSRKKGRSRGRAQVEDEESMDAMEKRPHHKTEVKEETEKTTGRRRSTSRRKSNTNPDPDPEPSQDRLSLGPKLHPDPTVLKSSPEPAPRVKDEDRTSPAPAAVLLPASSPGEEPRFSPLPPSASPLLDRCSVHSPASSPRPAPDPVEEAQPSPGHSPAPMEVDCSAGTVPMETEGGGTSPGASPMEQSPTLSPCSSPPVSPCPRLEDEDSLSPLFQRSMSEDDSGASPTPSLGHTQKRFKQCAFCYCGDEPPLGQGRLVVFGPTPGYIPLHVLNRRASSDRDNDCHDHCYRGNQAPPLCSSPEQCEDESSSEFVEQLGPIGLPHDINVQSLFDPTGQCCAHLQCAAWSEGVCRGEGQSLLYVDKAIDSGSTQVCAFCRRLGASLRCWEEGCGRSYHFPCAAAAGAHQDWNQRRTLCTRHTQTVFSQCVLCSSGGDVSRLLMCCCCGNCYHGSCLDPPLAPSPLCRAGWQCLQCRVCQSCRLRGDDGALLVCDRCDKAYHTHCLTPPLDHTPSNGWSCKNCRICRRCGVRSSGRWANHPFLCASCDPALPCPLCGHAPDLYTAQEYLTCTCCYRCVHTECIVQAGQGRAGSESYICSTCRTQTEDLIPKTPILHSPTPALPTSPPQAQVINISEPPVHSHAEDPPISPTVHSPAHFDCPEPPQSPTKTTCTPLQHSLTPAHPDPSELPQSPVPTDPDLLELQQSPVPTDPDPSELPQSPAPTDPDPSKLPQSPVPTDPDPSELPQSPAPTDPDPSELPQSPAPVDPDPSKLPQSPAPTDPDLLELQQSPVPTDPDPSELPQSPAPADPDLLELQQSPVPTHHDPSELQQSPAPTHPDPSELQQSPVPTHPDPLELQQSPVPSHPDLSELQQSPVPSHPDLSELQQSPAPTHPDPSELQQSPAPSHPDLSELQQSPVPTHPDPSELQQSPVPSHPDLSELQQSPVPTHPDPSELQQSPVPSHPDLSELQQSPVPTHPDPSELQQSPAPTDSQPSELQQIHLSFHSNPTEHQESSPLFHSGVPQLESRPMPSHPVTAELQQSPSLSNPKPTELQQSPSLSHPESTELQQSPPPFHLGPAELQESQTPSPISLTEFQQTPTQAHCGPTELQKTAIPSPPGPAELQQSPTHRTPTQTQHSPHGPSCTSSSPTQNSTEEQLITTGCQQSSTHGSPVSCGLAHSHSPLPNSSPPHIKPGLTEPWHSPPPHSPAQDSTTQTQPDRSCSPAVIVISHPQHSHSQSLHSPAPHSPAQVGTSPPQSPTQDAQSTLDQDSPGSSSPVCLQNRVAQDISTLDQDPSSVYCRSTQTPKTHASLSPISAACSPSPSPLRPTQCSQPQPAIQVQAHFTQPGKPLQLSLLPPPHNAQSKVTEECTQTSTTELKSLEHSLIQPTPNISSQPLEISPVPLSPTSELSTVPPDILCTDGQLPNQLGPIQSIMLSPDHSSPSNVPAIIAPESLFNIRTSTKHSSPIVSPCADETERVPLPASHIHQSPCRDKPSRCMEGKVSPVHIQASSATASPTHASEMPTSPASSFQACDSSMPMETRPAHISPLAAETSPSAVLARPVHPLSCQDEEMQVAVDHSTLCIQSEADASHPNTTPGSPVHASATYAGPVHSEANSGCSLMGTVNAQKRISPPVSGFAELAPTQTSQSPTHPGQSSPSHIQTTCSPSQTTPASFSPPHCRPTGTSPTSNFISHSLSKITSDHSGHTDPHSASLTDVSAIHSPPRSSPAGQTSPGAHSGRLQRGSPSLTNLMYSSPAHGPVICVSPPHSPAQASETYCSPKGSPHYSPAPNTGTSSGLNVAQLNPSLGSSGLDVDTVAGSGTQSSVLPSADQCDPGLVKPSDRIMPSSPEPAASLPDNSPAASPNQGGVSQVSQPPVSPHHDRSAVESQQRTASVSPFYQRPPLHVDATSTRTSLGPPLHSSPTQDNTAMPSTSRTSDTPASPPPPAPPSSHASQAQASSMRSSPGAIPACGPMDSGYTQTTPSPGPVSPVWPGVGPSPGPDSSVRCEASSGPSPVCPVPATPLQSESSPSPGPASPVQPDAGPGPENLFVSSHQEDTETERESVATLGTIVVGEQEEVIEERKAEGEEMDSETLGVDKVEQSHQTTKESPEDDPVGRTKAEGGHDQEENPASGVQSALVLYEDHRSPSHTAAAPPFLPQLIPLSPQPSTPHSALPLRQPSCSRPTFPVPSPQSPPPPSPPRAGSLEVSPSSSPHRTALPPSCSPHLEDCLQEAEPTSRRGIETETGSEVGLEDETLSSQSQSQFEPVAAAIEATKDKHQSHAEPSERKEEEGPPEMLEPASDGAEAPEVVTNQQPMQERKDAKEEEEEVEGATGRMDEGEMEEAGEGSKQEDQSDVEEEELVSPVLDLDPSFDQEVMELMSTSSLPNSLLHLSSPTLPDLSRRGKGLTLRPPPCSSRPSDDLSIRLRQSPFSTEASPETSPTRAPVTPPPLSPPSPPLRSSFPARESPPLKAPPTTVLPFTPKIGMGKPAISKRKFSPGRARVKQGSWWSNRRAVSPPSSSQDSTGEGGWDSPKPRPPDSPLWSMRVGRGSGFPGRRRSRGGGVGGGRGGTRGRSRLKTQDSLTVSPGCGYVEQFQPKEEEENSMHNTVVMFSTSDHFTLRQDMCVVCGSFGQGAEGRLLACSQCGQCYHPYCVNVKITRVVLTKGWRCLECTVCEACGEASDPGRLLLCDDCDISYHTYCLDPPLHTVPKGAWKCKWCVWCVQCGSASPGLHCDWQSNYSRCGPCASLSHCPLCQRQYTQDDLILQCQQCDRWVHAVCQGLASEDEVEVAADEGFDCSLCRAHSRGSYGRSDSFDSPYMAQIISRIREPDTKTYTQDGVCLTESGLSHLQSLVEPLTSPRRYRRCKPKLKLRIINQNSVSVLQTPPDPDPPTEQDHHRGDVECEMKSDSSPERDHTHDDDVTKEPEVTDGNKKRKRKPYRPGIGGFMVRQRGGKAGPSRIKLCRKDSTETLLGRDEGLLDADVALETVPPSDQAMEKVKKRYRKKKTKLEEAFPSYLQEAFFGRDLLDQSRQVDRRAGPETPAGSQSGAVAGDMKSPAPGLHGPSPSGLLVDAMTTNRKQGTLPMSEEALVDLSDVLNTDPHILATGHTGQFQVERSPSPFAGLDISSMANDTSLTSELTGSGGCGQRAVQEEPLDAILSPELDKMVTDGAILSKLYKIPELEGKDVEEVFTAVLSPDSSNQPEQNQHTRTAAGSKTHTQHTAGAFPRLPLMNGLMGAAPHFPNASMVPSDVQGPAGFRIPPPEVPAPAPPPGPGPGLASANQAPAGEGEQDVLSTAQRGMLKWEKEETLGELATVAPVLYCNTNFPRLREQYPDWSTRVKQIAKLWRKASSQDRAPYVQKARDNRAAQRINKVQLSNDPLKRHPPSQQQQQQQPPPPPPPLPPGPYDPVSMETEVAFKDPLRPKESEQEQEWKFRQGEVKDRWGAGKKRQENLPQSKALKSPTDKDCPYQASVAGGGKEALQMRQKSKQLAKMEATQKLEQVKNEQRQQQLLANQRLAGRLSPETGSRSPVTPAQQPAAGGSASPLCPPASREGQSRQHLLLQGGQSSGLADDVFLRPQAPPPSGFSSLPHSPHSSSPLHQPPSSPQMFSPPSSRPSSPWDPYCKVAGTPRPTSSQSGGPTVPQQQRHSSLSASPAHDAFGSPAPSPDPKTSDVSRVLGPQPGLQQGRGGMMSPSSGSAPDHTARHAGIRAAETYQRSPHNSGNLRAAVSELYGRAGELVQGGVFKAPMPPHHQPQQEMFGSTGGGGGGGGGGRRDPSRPTDLGFALPQSQDPPFPSSPLSGLGSPHCSPYAQTPGTPRPDYNQHVTDPFTQQSPLTSRPSPDPYSNPQTPGTPRPHSDPTYLTTPPALRLDQYNQQSANRRPSPSHPTLDPYTSNPGTPCPSLAERFPRSPGSQRSADPYAQPVGTPRPSPDPYAQKPSTPRPQKAPEPFVQAPVESFTPQPTGSGSSPLAPGLSGETAAFTPAHHQLQQSPGRQQQQQDTISRTPSSHTPKHPGMSEEGGFSGVASQTPGHDPFEQGHMTPGPSQMDKTTAHEMAGLGVASLDGPMSMLPQPGDSEEKLRQRQRLRQLILRQQQQKSVLRQEKGLQEPASGPAAPPAAPPGPTSSSGTPRHWSQEDSSASTAPPADPFGRPPPPYPGTVRPGGPAIAPALRFPSGFPGEVPFPRQSLTRELSIRGPAVRFGVPTGAPAALQDSFLRPPQGSVPGSGLSVVEGVPVQMRRPMLGEFTGTRPLTAPITHPHVPGVPQPYLPRSLPIQQHSIMGQPYIELRHRAPENRLRLPFPLSSAPNPEAPLLHPRDPQPSVVRAGQGARMGDTSLGQQMVMAGGVEHLNQQDQQQLGHTAALTQSSESALPGADGMEEHLEGEDSAVKDLEDVEVKDLVDLNLNLDPEDGKEDLDLGPNDLHLDDFLLSGKFDLIAYADPELNLEDKKDMFNEELDLEPVEEKEGGERRDGAGGSRKTDSHILQVGQVKQEVKTEVRDSPSAAQHLTAQPATSRPPGPPGASGTKAAGSSQPGSSVLLTKEKVEDSGSGSGTLPALQVQEQALLSGMAPRVHPPVAAAPGQQSVFQQQQRPFLPSPSPSALLTSHPQGLLVSPHPSLTPQGPPAPPHPQSIQPPQPRLLFNPQTQPPHTETSTQTQDQVQNQNKPRPLLLEEQPLLLQDLLDQERQEQQQQKQMQALIRQRSTSDPVFPNMDFDSISDPIMKAKMVALKGINKVMSQGSLGLSPMVVSRFQQTPPPGTPGPEGSPQPPHVVGQDGKLNPQMVRPSPPSFGPGFVNESQRRQYEEWLGETQQLLQMQQRLLEDQIATHRKTKKALSAKQRTAKKAGRAFAEEDAAQLRYITEQQGAVQKQLEQIRKQQKDHAELIEDYRTKQQQQRALQQQQQPPSAPPMMPVGVPPIPQTLLSQPMMSIQPHGGGPAPACVPSAPTGWTSGGRAPGAMGQRMPHQLPSQMPPTPPNAPQASPHTQTPPVIVPSLASPTAGFSTGPQGPTGGPNGASGDGAPTPQVKFDDNNPFSEGFQERERRERLREQQERQRVQLMQEVERHRVLQQRLELEQQGLLGASLGPGAGVAAMPPAGARVGQIPGGPAGPAPAPGGDGLSQMPFFSSELPQDFLQSPPASRPPPQHQGQVGLPFPPQSGVHQGFTGPLHPGAHPAPGVLPGVAAERGPPVDVAPSNLQTRPRLPGPTGSSSQAQVHPTAMGAAVRTPSHPGSQSHQFGHDSSSSSPLTPLPHSFPCSSSGGPASLIQLYSDIIPDDKPKKKRNRKRDGDDSVGAGGSRTPLSSHSDDITAPLTPAVSDTSCSTPTRGSVDQSDAPFPGLAPSSELERQLSVSSAAQQRASVLGTESQRGPLSVARLEVKEEQEEGGACGGGVVKMDESGGEGFSSPSPLHGGGKDGDGGKELLRHLLKDKTSPATTPSPTGKATPTARRQLTNESARSEEEDRTGSCSNVVTMDSPGPDQLDSSSRKKTQRCKRLARPEKDRAPPKYKRRKREEEEKTLHSSSDDPLMTHLRQLSVLPLMEPVLGVDLSLFPPYGSSSLGRDSRLTGSFGNACLDGVTDYYSQLIYKNNLSNPPTPPASLPPTPPPVARQKLVNGFATTEELSKDITEQEVKGVPGLKQKGEELLALNHAPKTVDVPASLPTPPHNNQEELRVQDSSERDSPDGFVPSSSPESVSDVEVSRYPDLSFIKLEPPSPCPSPTIPIMPCAWGKGSAVKQEVKAEPNLQGPPSCSNTDLVTIAITLNPVAAQNVAGVMAAVAELLRVPVPVDYQLSRAAGAERSSLALLAGVRVPLTQGSSGSRHQRPPPAAGNTGVRMDYIQHGCSAAAARPQSCSHCKVLLGNGVRVVRELKQVGLRRRLSEKVTLRHTGSHSLCVFQEGPSRPGSSLVFCSPHCSALYTSDPQSRSAGHKPAVPVLLSDSEAPPPSRGQHQYTNNMSSIAVHSLPHTPPTPPPTSSSSPTLSFPPASAITMETKPRIDSLKVKVKLKPRPRAVPDGEDLSRHVKRMKSSRWRRWSVSIRLSRGPCIPNEAVAMPTEEEVDVLLKRLGACFRPEPLPKDQRRCCFCHQQGDGQTDGPARLLNLDLDLWVHLNCALWSSEVYETQAGALINVELALRRGLTLRCAHCQQTGATSGCNRLRCTNTYHFTCALQAHCTFFKDKTMLCHLHKPRTVPLSGDRSSSGSPSSTPGQTPDPAALVTSDPYDSELRCFSVFRRVYVQRDEARQIAAVVQRGERQHTFRVGSLLFRAVGRLLPQQMKAFHNESAIFPVGYHANRIYWSMRHSSRRCKYMCCIEDRDGQPLFKVKVVEKGHDDLILTGPTPKAVWDQILEPVSQMRSSSGTLKLFPVYLKGEDLFGLTTSAVTRIIESLPGVEACERYTFRYGRNPLMEWPLAFNPSGSARSEPKACQAKRPYLLTSIAPRCQGSVGSIVGLVPGVISLSPGESVAGAHQGRHSKSSQYRRMKAEWKSNVYLARSRIQGLGLYAARDIEKCTMVIEYIGTIIRSEVANRKERLYESQNRGVYMFRIDNDYVIDATITGGPARYINHSCAPNCITEVVTVERENKIIISSCRRIQRGEELCYDYKFDLEDDQHKIPCHCGAVNCRKWMN